jgi:hypothetical protein
VKLIVKLCSVAAVGLAIYASPRLTRGQANPTWLKPESGAAAAAVAALPAGPEPRARASAGLAPGQATPAEASPAAAAIGPEAAESAVPAAAPRPRRQAAQRPVQPGALNEPIEFRLADRGN